MPQTRWTRAARRPRLPAGCTTTSSDTSGTGVEGFQCRGCTKISPARTGPMPPGMLCTGCDSDRTKTASVVHVHQYLGMKSMSYVCPSKPDRLVGLETELTSLKFIRKKLDRVRLTFQLHHAFHTFVMSKSECRIRVKFFVQHKYFAEFCSSKLSAVCSDRKLRYCNA